MEANNIFKKISNPQKLTKINHNIYQNKKKKCKITLLYEFEVRI